MRRGERLLEIRDRLPLSAVDVGLDLMFEDRPRPAELLRRFCVSEARGGVFDHFDDFHDLPPTGFGARPQLVRFLSQATREGDV